jgi:AcrR family transcriptional regulator
MSATDVDTPTSDTRQRLISAAAELLASSAGEPVSTRAICAAAGVGAPTLYHHFGDKQGLFDAVVARGFEDYLATKRARVDTGDPVADLRIGWDTHVEYGLTNPAFYTLMYGLGQQGRRPPAAAEAHRILTGMLEKIAIAGRLAMPVREAADLLDAAGVGVTLALIAAATDGTPDMALSARTRDAMLAVITTDRPAGHADRAGGSTLASLAIALDAAVAGDAGPLSGAEVALLHEWLNRLAQSVH